MALLMWVLPLTAAHSPDFAASPPVSLASTQQFSQAGLTLSYSVIGGGSGFSPPVFSYLRNNVTQKVLLTSQSSTIAADISSHWTVSSVLNGSGGSERWATDSAASGVVLGGESLAFVYFHQYAMVAHYTIPNGNSPSPPSLQSMSFGKGLVAYLSQTEQIYWLDRGAGYVLSGSLTGSSSTERWVTNSVGMGSMVAPLTLSLTYFHQLMLSIAYLPPSMPSTSSPVLAFASFGRTVNESLSAGRSNLWVDDGTSLKFHSLEVASAPGERWMVESALPQFLGSSLTATLAVVHQYDFELSYVSSGGGSPPTPSLKGVSFGNAVNANLSKASSQFWVDAGTPWSVPSLLSGGAQSERWIAPGGYGGDVNSPVALNITYTHQYYVQIPTNLVGGTVTQTSGWYDAGSILAISAMPAPGWVFGGWQGTGSGTYTGGNSSVTLRVVGPFEEALAFDAILKVSSGTQGSVTYLYGTDKETVKPGESVSLGLPPGTNVTFVATPSSFLYTFKGWSGASRSSSGTVGLTVRSPAGLVANFSINYYALYGIIALYAILVVVCGVYIVNRTRWHVRDYLREKIGPLFEDGTT
ncbi:MAG: hypothetical protein OK452_07120 [Thaumarchaeota archaeon]|nr:hypothetical protein [Nitrososphaerota archaeon]